MRKTILVIGAAIGLAAALASSAHATDIIDDVQPIVAVELADVVKADLNTPSSHAVEIERMALNVGFEPSTSASHESFTLVLVESTKLDSDHGLASTNHNGYRQHHEVGWRI